MSNPHIGLTPDLRKWDERFDAIYLWVACCFSQLHIFEPYWRSRYQVLTQISRSCSSSFQWLFHRKAALQHLNTWIVKHVTTNSSSNKFVPNIAITHPSKETLLSSLLSGRLVAPRWSIPCRLKNQDLVPHLRSLWLNFKNSNQSWSKVQVLIQLIYPFHSFLMLQTFSCNV